MLHHVELPDGLVVREFTASDSISDLTRLLHAAYAQLARRGLRYVATYQDDETTRRRITGGTCLLSLVGDRLVGTVTVKRTATAADCEWYARPEVALCGQLGVDPEFQGRGIGRRLMDLGEERAWSAGAQEIALDTAEQADDLIAWYLRRGYRAVGRVNRTTTNFESVVLSKNLARMPNQSN